MKKTVLVALVFWSAQADSARADVSGPDPADPSPTSAFWNTNGQKFGLPYLDAGGLVQFQWTQVYLASNTLIDSHCKDGGGTTRAHVHIQDDYTVANVAAADAYWDMRFGVKQNICTKVASAGSTKLNCFAYALGNFTGKGIYNYWIDYNPPGSGNLDNAMNADTQGVAKGKVVTNDILYYKGPITNPPTAGAQHASGVIDYYTDKSVQSNYPQLQWRFGNSGIYSVF